MIWPDIDATIVEKVLTWSLEGQEVLVKESEAAEVKETIRALGLDFKMLVKDPYNEQRRDTCFPELTDDPDDNMSDLEDPLASPESCEHGGDPMEEEGDFTEDNFRLVADPLKKVCADENSISINDNDNAFEIAEGLESEDDVCQSNMYSPSHKESSSHKRPQKSLSKDTVMLRKEACKTIQELPVKRLEFENSFKQCPYCNLPSKKLLSHLSSYHYGSEILEKVGQKDLKICNICGHNVTKSKSGSGNQKLMAIHLGVVHGLIETLLPQSTKDKLVKKDDSSTANKFKNTITCPVCNQYEALNFSNLKQHLAGTDLRKEILIEAGISNIVKPCPHCGAEKKCPTRRQGMADWRKHMAEHIGNRHDYLSKVMPKEAKARWEAIKADHARKKYHKM